MTHDAERRLHADGGDRADDDDGERGRREQRVQARAFQHGTDHHGKEPQGEAGDA